MNCIAAIFPSKKKSVLLGCQFVDSKTRHHNHTLRDNLIDLIIPNSNREGRFHSVTHHLNKHPQFNFILLLIALFRFRLMFKLDYILVCYNMRVNMGLTIYHGNIEQHCPLIEWTRTEIKNNHYSLKFSCVLTILI